MPIEYLLCAKHWGFSSEKSIDILGRKTEEKASKGEDVLERQQWPRDWR